jgi:hypothetical protein
MCKHSRHYLHSHTCECKHAKQHAVPNRGRFHAAAPRPETHHVWRRLDFNLRAHTPQGENAHHLEFALRACTWRRCRNRLPPALSESTKDYSLRLCIVSLGCLLQLCPARTSVANCRWLSSLSSFNPWWGGRKCETWTWGAIYNSHVAALCPWFTTASKPTLSVAFPSVPTAQKGAHGEVRWTQELCQAFSLPLFRVCTCCSRMVIVVFSFAVDCHRRHFSATSNRRVELAMMLQCYRAPFVRTDERATGEEIALLLCCIHGLCS